VHFKFCYGQTLRVCSFINLPINCQDQRSILNIEFSYFSPRYDLVHIKYIDHDTIMKRIMKEKNVLLQFVVGLVLCLLD